MHSYQQPTITDETRRELLGTRYTLESDPGHGWLRVPYRHMLALGITDAVSNYSYQESTDDGAVWWLEEDCDANVFAMAYHVALGQPITVDEQFINHNSRVRRLESVFHFDAWKDRADAVREAYRATAD